MTVQLANGRSATREVTSEPNSADTDEDGVSDRDEKNDLSDPRDEDTDDDQLSDYQELNHVYSDPSNQDSDGDTLADGLEFTFFRTSPTLPDSDGDLLLDWDEINLGNRNPRLADLPRPSIEVGAVDLQLDVRFAATSQRGTRELEARSVSSTLTQTDNQSASNTDSNSHEFFFKRKATKLSKKQQDARVSSQKEGVISSFRSLPREENPAWSSAHPSKREVRVLLKLHCFDDREPELSRFGDSSVFP